MKTSIEAIAAEIVALPQRFHSLRDVSIFLLLEATGYFRLHDQISAGDIRAALLRCPESSEEWMQYSEDKRTSSGWYLTQNDEGRDEVGYFTERGGRQRRVVYEKCIDACAAFIKREIEDIRLH